jgi:molybdopterin molybdotransferase
MVTFALFGVPLLRAMQGDTAPLPMTRQARCGSAFQRAEPGRTELVRAKVTRSEDGDAWATPIANQASGAASAMAQANALIRVPAEATRIERGDPCEVWMLEELGA